MATIGFEPPVGILLGRPGQRRAVSSLREAADCLMNPDWPERGSDAFHTAFVALIAASDGLVDADKARLAFAEAAKEAGILVEEKLMH